MLQTDFPNKTPRTQEKILRDLCVFVGVTQQVMP